MPVLRFPIPYRVTADTLHVGTGVIEVAEVDARKAPVAMRQVFHHDNRMDTRIDLRLAEGILWEPVQTSIDERGPLTPSNMRTVSNWGGEANYWSSARMDNPFVRTPESARIHASITHKVKLVTDKVAMGPELVASDAWAAAVRKADSVRVIGNTIHVPSVGPVLRVDTRNGAAVPLCRLVDRPGDRGSALDPNMFSFRQADEMADAYGTDVFDMGGDSWAYRDGFGPDDIPGAFDPFPAAVLALGAKHLSTRKKLMMSEIPPEGIKALLALRAAYPQVRGKHVAVSGMTPHDVAGILRHLQDAMGPDDWAAGILDTVERRLAFRGHVPVAEDDAALSMTFG